MNVQFNVSLLSSVSLITALLLIHPVKVQAEFFKYKDSSGTLVITNKFEDVPKKYRKSVKVVWDDELVAKDPYARRAAAAEVRYQDQQRQQALQQEQKSSSSGKTRPSDGKTLVITFDEATGQLIRTME